MELLKKDELLEKYQHERVKCDKWTRCMGYYRPAVMVDRERGTVTSSYNLGKQSEFNQRVWFKTQKSLRDREC